MTEEAIKKLFPKCFKCKSIVIHPSFHNKDIAYVQIRCQCNIQKWKLSKDEQKKLFKNAYQNFGILKLKKLQNYWWLHLAKWQLL